MIDLTGFTQLELARHAQIQDLLIRDLEAELAKRDAMISQAVGVMLKAKAELEPRPPITAASAAMDNGRYHSLRDLFALSRQSTGAEQDGVSGSGKDNAK